MHLRTNRLTVVILVAVERVSTADTPCVQGAGAQRPKNVGTLGVLLMFSHTPRLS